jgi:hypothetical protein
MAKRTTKNGITTTKARGITIKVNDREMAKMDAEQAAQQAAKDEHHRVCSLMNAISSAKIDLQGTVHVMSVIIDSNSEYEDGVPLTLERWIRADMEALDRAFDAAWDGIVRRDRKEVAP